MMIRSLASALTMHECRAKYKAAQTKRGVGLTWVNFQEKYCGAKANSGRARKALTLGRLSWRPLSFQTQSLLSLLGTKRTCSLERQMSVVGGRTDLTGNRRHFRV